MASKLTSANIARVGIQTDMDSPPVDDNFQALKDKVNELVDEIAAAAIGTTNAETTAARPYHIALKNRLDSVWTGRRNYLKEGGSVTVDSDGDSVTIAAGQAKVNGIDVNWAGASSGAISAAAAGKHRIDVAVIQSDNTLAIVTGSEKTQDSTEYPPFPSIADTKLELAWIYVDDTGAVDLSDNVYTITKEDSFGSQDILLSGGALDEQGTPDMSFTVSAGSANVNDVFCTWVETNIRNVPVAASDVRLDLIVVDENGYIFRIQGTAAASPDFPSAPANTIILGALVLKPGTTSINHGVEAFSFLNGSNDYFPNLYINANYTATDKRHNNVIVDMSSAVITGTLECQGNCWIANYDSTGSNGSGEGFALQGSFFKDDDEYTIANRIGDTVVGTGGTGAGSAQQYNCYIGNAGGVTTSVSFKAFNIYIYDITFTGGNGDDGVTTVTVESGKIGIGACGGSGGNSGNVILEAVNEIEILSNGTIGLNGGSGGDSSNASTGTIANIGGGSNGGSGGNLTMTAKTITENGNVNLNGGSGGAAGTGSGGSDNNANGTSNAGGNGSKTSTEYDFTTGLSSTYADWINPLYMKGIA